MASSKSSATESSDAFTNPNDLQSGIRGGASFTGEKLDEGNYFQWSLSMWMFICEKGKESYLSDESVPPDEGSSDFCHWRSENNLVMSWLIDSMPSDISEDFISYQTASEIWLAAKEMFFIRKGITLKIFEIESSLQDLKQGESTVVQYYNQLSRKWQKLDMFDVHEWRCPEDAKNFKEIVDEKRLFKFLMGLNRELDEIRVHLLGRKTLPKLRDAFSEVRHAESRRKLMVDEGSALNVKRNPQDKLENNAKKGKGWCDHCKITRPFEIDRKPSKLFAERVSREIRRRVEESSKASPFSEEQVKAPNILISQHLVDHNNTSDVSQIGFSFTEVNSVRASPNKVGCCHFSSDGKLLASGGHDKKAVLWYTDTLKPKTTLEEHSMIITDVRFSPSMARLATSSFDKTVRVWDADNSGYSLRTFTGHSDGVMSLDFHPNKDDLICSCDGDSEIRYWSINNGSCTRVFKGGSHQVRFQPRHGRYLAAAGENLVSILDVETQACRHSLKGHTKPIHSICWDSSGELLASVSDDSVRVWSMSEGECVHELSCNGNKFYSCTFHHSYSSLLVIGCYQSLELWNMTENKTMTLAAHDGLVTALAASPVAGLVASASQDKIVKLWK